MHGLEEESIPDISIALVAVKSPRTFSKRIIFIKLSI